MTQTTITPPPEYKTACGGKLKDPTNYPSAIYRSERVYFCTRACLRAFEQDPDPLSVHGWRSGTSAALRVNDFHFFCNHQAILVVSLLFLHTGGLYWKHYKIKGELHH